MKKYKQATQKLGALMLALLMFLVAIPSTQIYANTKPPISVLIDGQPVNFTDQQPQIVDGRTLVPVRGVFEKLGFEVSYNPDLRQATLARADVTIVITIDSPTFKVEDERSNANIPLDVPAQIIGGSTMLPIRGVLESVGYGLTFDDKTQTVLISTSKGGAEVMTTEVVDDLIWLDENTSVSRSQIVKRLAQQQVEYDSWKGANKGTTRPVGEQSKAFVQTDFASKFASKEILVQRAKGFMESLYNINYLTDTKDKVVDTLLKYSSPNTPNSEAWKQLGVDGFKAVQDQKIIMKSVFVADESLVYALGPNSSTFDRNGKRNSPPAEWGVRGTLFYQFESNSGGDYWGNPASGSYEMGQWYWYDVEVRFQQKEGFAEGKTMAATDPFLTVVLNPDGTQVEDQSKSIIRSLSNLPK